LEWVRIPSHSDRSKLTKIIGVNTSVVPVYQSECAKAAVRGRLVILANISNTIAFCLANWMNYGIYFRGGAFQWRFPLAFQLVFAVIAVPIMMYLPESPRWLLLKDRSEEALEVLARLEGKNVRTDDPEVIKAHDSIIIAIQEERRDVVPVKDVFLFRDETQNLRRLLLSCGTQLMQQFSGVNALGQSYPPVPSCQS
jgi:MFS family permease